MMKDFLDEFTEEIIFSLIRPRPVFKQKIGFPYLQQPVKFMPSLMHKSELKQIQPQIQIPASKIQAVPMQLPVSVDKIDFLLRNPRVTAVECPGPEKFVIVRKGFRTELTRITLTEEEIKNKIREFSEKARIPLIGGLFKATIGNLTISAVISDYAGSRFIISKFFPTNIPHAPGLPNPSSLKAL